MLFHRARRHLAKSLFLLRGALLQVLRQDARVVHHVPTEPDLARDVVTAEPPLGHPEELRGFRRGQPPVRLPLSIVRGVPGSAASASWYSSSTASRRASRNNAHRRSRGSPAALPGSSASSDRPGSGVSIPAGRREIRRSPSPRSAGLGRLSGPASGAGPSQRGMRRGQAGSQADSWGPDSVPSRSQPRDRRIWSGVPPRNEDSVPRGMTVRPRTRCREHQQRSQARRARTIENITSDPRGATRRAGA